MQYNLLPSPASKPRRCSSSTLTLPCRNFTPLSGLPQRPLPCQWGSSVNDHCSTQQNQGSSPSLH
jgi:hypothetical protein